MKVSEKVAYIKGLAEGLALDDSTKEGKVINSVIDALEEIAREMEEKEGELNSIADLVVDMGESLSEIENDLYGDEDDECGEEEDMYELTCPSCNNSITVDYDVISSGSIVCPNCGAKLEPDLSALEEGDDAE